MTLMLQDMVRNKPCPGEILGFVDGCCGENLVIFLLASHAAPGPPLQFECQSLLLAGRKKMGLGMKRACSKVYEGLEDSGNLLQIHCH